MVPIINYMCSTPLRYCGLLESRPRSPSSWKMRRNRDNKIKHVTLEDWVGNPYKKTSSHVERINENQKHLNRMK